MKIAASGLIAAAVVVVAGTASAQQSSGTVYQPYQQTQPYQTQQTQPYQNPAFQTQQTQPYQAPPAQNLYGGQDSGITYGTLPTPPNFGGNQGYQVQQQPAYSQPGYPVPQPYGTPTQTIPGYPAPPPPVNPNPAPRRGEVADTDAWTFSVARYYPAIQACLRNTKVSNPVVANIQERRNATVMLIGQGGTAEYQVCRTGLNGTRVREGKSERGLPPAFYAPNGSSFTITPDRPFQPVVDTGQRLLGWIVRTTPVRLDTYGGGRTFDGQFIKPVTVNPGAQ